MHKKIGMSIYIIIGGLLFNLAFYMLLNHLLFFGNTLNIHRLIRDVTTVFGLTIGHVLVVFLVLYIIKCFKRQWPSLLIPSIIITTLTFIVILLGNIDKYAELAEPQEQSTSSLYQEEEIHINSHGQGTYTYANGNKYAEEQKQSKRDTLANKDAKFSKALIGTWEEYTTNNCVNYHVQTTYNSDKTFIDFTKLTANGDCRVRTIYLSRGQSKSLTSTGRWWVDNGYLYHYVDFSSNEEHTDIGEKYLQRIIAVDNNNYKFERDDMSINTARRIELDSHKEEPGLDANSNMNIYQEQSTSSLYQEEEIHISKHVQGTYTWPNGDKYVGEWKDDMAHGQGTITYANGDKYVGEWKDGKRRGQGTYTFSNGGKYEGEWKDGMMLDQGTYTWANGDKYEGEWKDDMAHGQGTKTYANGDKYVGEWKDSWASGGWFYRSNGQKTWSHENTSGKWIHSTNGKEEKKN